MQCGGLRAKLQVVRWFAGPQSPSRCHPVAHRAALSRHKPWRSITARPVVKSDCDCPVWGNRSSLWSTPMNARSNARWVRRPASGEDRETGPPGPPTAGAAAKALSRSHYSRAARTCSGSIISAFEPMWARKAQSSTLVAWGDARTDSLLHASPREPASG
jgi:hypothetical protein